MVSIGGITYVKAWNAALSQGATLLGQKAAALATRGVETQPPNTCEGDVGVGATTYAIPIPMAAVAAARDRPQALAEVSRARL